jgi:hypothetical protein
MTAAFWIEPSPLPPRRDAVVVGLVGACHLKCCRSSQATFRRWFTRFTTTYRAGAVLPSLCASA